MEVTTEMPTGLKTPTVRWVEGDEAVGRRLYYAQQRCSVAQNEIYR